MSISFDKALGIHEKALGFRSQRAEVLANNIANADTPNYKARDLDFGSVLAEQSAQGRGGFAATRTSDRHIAAEGWKSPMRPCVFAPRLIPPRTRNTVDLQIEQSNYAKNAVDFVRASPCSTASSGADERPARRISKESNPCPSAAYSILPAAA